MKLIFLGNGPFAAPALGRIAESEHDLALVVARPDLPSGKHQRVVPGPVASLATELSLPLVQPPDVNEPAFVASLVALTADLMIVADFGQFLKKGVREACRLGAINIHGSLLPKYRGAAPIAWSVYHGEREVGVSIIRVVAKMDAGAILARRAIPLDPDITTGRLEPLLADLGADAVLETIERLGTGLATDVEQVEDQATVAPRLAKEDGRIDWSRGATQIHNQVRAFVPWPISFTEWRRAHLEPLRLQILQTRVVPPRGGEASPGDVVAVEGPELVMRAGDGELAILRLKPAGKREMDVPAFVNGYGIRVGQRLG